MEKLVTPMCDCQVHVSSNGETGLSGHHSANAAQLPFGYRAPLALLKMTFAIIGPSAFGERRRNFTVGAFSQLVV